MAPTASIDQPALTIAVMLGRSEWESAGASAALVTMLVIVVTLGVLGGRLAGWWHRRSEAKRTAEIQAVLKRLSYSPAGEGAGVDVRFLAQFWIGRNRVVPQIFNHFVANPRAGEVVQVMDFASLETSGKHKVMVWQTLAAVFHDRLQLPAFALASQKFATVVILPKDVPDIEIDKHPEFKKLFRLQGADEAAVRALFVPSLVRELERHPGISIEGNGSCLMLYRRRTRVKAAELPKFQEEIRKLAQLFLS